jgi:hypothetical protein
VGYVWLQGPLAGKWAKGDAAGREQAMRNQAISYAEPSELTLLHGLMSGAGGWVDRRSYLHALPDSAAEAVHALMHRHGYGTTLAGTHKTSKPGFNPPDYSKPVEIRGRDMCDFLERMGRYERLIGVPSRSLKLLVPDMTVDLLRELLPPEAVIDSSTQAGLRNADADVRITTAGRAAMVYAKGDLRYLLPYRRGAHPPPGYKPIASQNTYVRPTQAVQVDF